MIIEFFSELVSPLWVDIVLFIGAAIGAYFVGVRKGNASMKKKMYAMEEDMRIIKKILVLMAKLTDEKTKSLHPDVTSELESVVERMLEKEK